jgi:alpha-tubulin suppressor-like RCC1 family protein
MNRFLRSGYTGLLVLVAAAPLSSVACGEDRSLGDVGDSGVDAAPDTSVGPEEDAAVDAGSDVSEPPVREDAAPPTIECTTSPCVVDITRGNDNTCVLTSAGAVYCWGDSPCGEVGAPLGGTDTDFKPVSAPRQVLTGVRAISAGAASTCAILNSGELRCWGSLVSLFNSRTSGGFGQACTPNATPTVIDGVPPLTAVSSSLSNGCGVTANEELWCWGSNGNGLLARDGYTPCSYYTQCDTPSYPPARADLLKGKAKDVTLAYGGAFAFTETGELQSWGTNITIGRTSSASVDSTPLPVALPNISSISVSLHGDGQSRGNNICAAAQGEIYCWGGYNAPPRIVALPPKQYAAQVSASLHGCARTVDGSVFCWGGNQAGQLGDGTGVDHYLVPTKVEGLKAKAAKVVTSKATTCALLVTGEVQCWGANDKGQLGSGSADFLPHLQPGSVVAFQ